MKRFLLFAILLGSAAYGQRASEALDLARGKTVEELVVTALQRNAEFLSGEQRIAAARGGVAQAQLKANPSFDLNGAHEINGSQNNLMLGLSLPLELYHRRQRRIEVAASTLKESEFDQAERKRQLRAAIESKFGDMLAAMRDLQFNEQLISLTRKQFELVETRVEQGSAPPLEANLLRVELSRIDAKRFELETRAEVSLLELKSLIGLKPEEELYIRGNLVPLPVNLTKDEAIRSALQTRPDILFARAAEQVADAKLRQAETDAKPDATVSANYQRMNSSFNQFGLDSAGQLQPIQGVFHYLVGGISITLPVRNRNQGTIQTAVAEKDEAKLRREYTELFISREITAAFVAQEKATESVRIFEVQIRTQANENLEVIRRTYELGRTPILDVIAEQRRLIEIEEGYTKALNLAFQASVRLRSAIYEGENQ